MLVESLNVTTGWWRPSLNFNTELYKSSKWKELFVFHLSTLALQKKRQNKLLLFMKFLLGPCIYICKTFSKWCVNEMDQSSNVKTKLRKKVTQCRGFKCYIVWYKHWAFIVIMITKYKFSNSIIKICDKFYPAGKIVWLITKNLKSIQTMTPSRYLWQQQEFAFFGEQVYSLSSFLW